MIRPIKRFAAIGFALCLILGSLAAQAVIVERIAAVVNDEIIMMSEVEEAAQSWRSMLAGIRDPEQRQAKQKEIYMQILDALIEDRLLLQQIAELKIEISAEDVDDAIARVMEQNNIPNMTALRMALQRQGIEWEDYRVEVTKQLAKWRFIHAKFSARVKIPDEEVKAAYQKEVEQADPEYEYRARHILVRVDADASPDVRADKLQKAKEALARLKAGEDFTELAVQYSEGPTAKFGGDLGYFRKGVMVHAFEDAVVKLKIGEISDVVESPFGYHVIELTDMRPVPVRTYEQAEPELRQKLREEAMQVEMAVWLKQIRQKAFIDIKLTDPPKQVEPEKDTDQ
jgi:peptidyl-prolyl cis-trans isomerase SurA